MCPSSDAIEFASMISAIFLALVRFEFFCFTCYAIHRIIRRIMR